MADRPEMDGTGAATERLLNIVARLRDPESGCPWDIGQTFRTVAPHTIEEAYEVADAIERGDPEDLRDELGDLLFQVVFHSRMAEESGAFAYSDVVEAIAEKMLRRHPHVFGDAKIETAAAQSSAWEEAKARERAEKPGGRSALSGVPVGLPALVRAAKLSKRAAHVGFDWTRIRDVFAKVREELGELETELSDENSGETDPGRVEAEIGDLLFTVANLARHLDIDPETSLRRANAKFERRFRAIEAGLAARGCSIADANFDEMQDLWDAIKTGAKTGESPADSA